MSLRTSLLCLLAASVGLPGLAQTPFFNDGPALGGSRSFSQGLNPLSNPARGELAPTGAFLSYLNGDTRFPDNQSALDWLSRPDAASQAYGLALGIDNPYSQRLRGYAMSWQSRSSAQQVNSVALTREEKSTAWIGASEGQPQIEQRRGIVDRLIINYSGSDQNGSAGISLRVERYQLGMAMLGASGAPGRNLDQYPDPLDFRETDRKSTTFAFDGGLIFNMAESFRLALSADRLFPRRLWDVYEQVQGHVGLQLDLGSLAQLRVETDTNKTQRFPIALKQRSAGASVKLIASRAITLLAGVERREWESARADGSNGMVSFTKFGGTIFYTAPSWRLGLGMQFGNDRPLKGITAGFGQ